MHSTLGQKHLAVAQEARAFDFVLERKKPIYIQHGPKYKLQ